MRSGRLRHRLELQAPAEVADSFGQRRKTWTTVGTYWGEVRPLAGREAEVARQTRADLTHAVTTRGGPAVTPKHRWLFEGRVLQVHSALDVGERGRQVDMLCQEILA